MAAGASNFLLLFLLSLLCVCSSGFSHHDRQKSTSLSSSPIRTVSLIKVLKSKILPKNGESVYFYLDQSQIESFSSSKSWRKTHIKASPYINIRDIALRSSGYDLRRLNEWPKLLSDLKSVRSVIGSLQLGYEVEVLVVFSLSFLEDLSRTREKNLEKLFGFLKEVRSFVVVEVNVDGKVNEGGLIVNSVIEKTKIAATLLRSNNFTMILKIKTPVSLRATEVAEFSDVIYKFIENCTEIEGRVAELWVEVSSMRDIASKEPNRKEFPFSRRELMSNFKTTLHDTFPATPTSAAPITTTPNPIIVTVPATNPVTTTPNPDATPIPIPSTNPVTVPSATPGNPPVPITNPVTTPTPITVPGAQPVTNPVTTYPAPAGNVPVTTPGFNPVAPVGNVPVTTPGFNPVAPAGNVPVTTPGFNPVAPAGNVPVTTPGFNPVVAPPTTNVPAIPGQSWCVAMTGTQQAALQSALDYACGMGGVDCSQLQQGGSCFNPVTLQNHASYAFNSYYQKNPVPTSCDFGGTAMIVNNNPSAGSCIYQTSAAASVTTPSTPTPMPTSTTPPTNPVTTPITNPVTTPITNPVTTPTTPATSPGGTGLSGYDNPPSVLNSSYPANVYGNDIPPAVISPTSASTGLQPFIGCIVLITSIVTRTIFFYV